MRILKTTPIFYLTSIEQALPFWQERLGYKPVAEAAPCGSLAFMILVRDQQEVMLQTFASAEEDLPGSEAHLRQHATSFYHEVDNLEEAMAMLDGLKVVGGPRTSHYGMREVYVVDGDGWVHGWAQRVAA